MSEIADLKELASLARRSIEPGLPIDGSGRPLSTGSCLHACLIVVMLLKRFGNGKAAVRGGSDGAGALDTSGKWRGHYWVEARTPSGQTFVVDVTADQFGHESVVVMPLGVSSGRYRKGPQCEVDEAFTELANEFSCRDMVAA